MRDRSSWLLLGLFAAIAIVLILAQNGTQQDSPEHSSKSDGPNGTSALVQYAAALGHPTRTVDFTLDHVKNSKNRDEASGPVRESFVQYFENVGSE